MAQNARIKSALRIKSASEPFTIRNILSEESEVRGPLAPGHQTRVLVINSKTASETASENQTRFISCVNGSPKRCLLGFLKLPVMVKFNLNGILPRKTTSCAEEAPLWASATVAFEEEAVGLVLGAIVNPI